MKTGREKARQARHGLRLDTPAPRVQETRKYPSRAQIRQENRMILADVNSDPNRSDG